MFAGAVAFLLPVVFSPSVQATFWTPAAALCLVVAGVGLPRLVALVRARSAGAWPAAAAALAFLLAGFVSALLAADVRLAFLGHYYWGTGWLFTAALVGGWALGRSLDGRGRRIVESAILAAALVNAVVAVLEAVVDLEAFHLGRYGGRSPGLLGNPVHLGAFAAAAMTLVAARLAERPRRWTVAAAVVILAAGVQTSGSRFGLVVLLGVVVWVFVAYRWRVGAVFAALAIAGLAVGTGAASGIDGGSALASGRIAATAGNGVTPRVETWKDGAEALRDRPLLGHGPGQFRAATSPLRGVEVARHEAPDRLFVDAHNLVVEYGVTTGVVGLAALLAMLAFGLRGAAGPLLAFAIAELANHLVEPQAVRTTPVAFLALGAAAAGAVGAPVISRGLRRAVAVATTVLVAVAVAAGAWLLVGDFHLEQARLDFGRYHARVAHEMLPWPEAAEVRSRVFLFEGRVTRDERLTERGIAYLRDAIDRDPRNPTLLNQLGYRLLGEGQLGESRRAFLRALRWNPVSTIARNGLARSALARGEPAEAAEWARSSLAIVPSAGARSILRNANEGADP